MEPSPHGANQASTAAPGRLVDRLWRKTVIPLCVARTKRCHEVAIELVGIEDRVETHIRDLSHFIFGIESFAFFLNLFSDIGHDGFDVNVGTLRAEGRHGPPNRAVTEIQMTDAFSLGRSLFWRA